MSKPFKLLNNTLGLPDTITFGKWNGYTVEQIMLKDPEWFVWAIANTQLYLTKPALKYLCEELLDKLKELSKRKETDKQLAALLRKPEKMPSPCDGDDIPF